MSKFQAEARHRDETFTEVCNCFPTKVNAHPKFYRVYLYASATLAVLLAACQSSPQSRVIVLQPSTGPAVRVPLGTSFVGDDVQQLAKQIAATDQKRPKGWNAASPELIATLMKMRTEARDEAIENLSSELQIEQDTSGGADDVVLARAHQALKELSELLSDSPPPALDVRTEISTADAPHTLRYMSRGDYQHEQSFWSSYTFGDQLHIGRYMFKVDSCETPTGDYVEPILILPNPTVFIIHPQCGQ